MRKKQSNNRMNWWEQAKFGMFIHWGLYSIPARGEWVMHDERIPVKEYEKLSKIFDPCKYDPVEWAKIAKKAGMKYMVLTTKHHEGYCLFDTKLTDYNSVKTKPGRDLVREYVDACRNEGLRVGLYYSVEDWHHKNYPMPKEHPCYIAYKNYFNPDEKLYFEYMTGQIRELLTNYGKIDILWFDRPYKSLNGKKFLKIIRECQPDIVVNNRVDGKMAEGDFVTPEQFIPNEPPMMNGELAYWESCNTMTGHTWGYNIYNDFIRSSSEIIDMVKQCLCAGGNFILNIGPLPDGSLEKSEKKVLTEIADFLKNDPDFFKNIKCGEIKKKKPGSTTKSKKVKYQVKNVPGISFNSFNMDVWGKAKRAGVSNETHFDLAPIRFPSARPTQSCEFGIRFLQSEEILYCAVDVKNSNPRTRKTIYFGDSVEFLFGVKQSPKDDNAEYRKFHILVDSDHNVLMPHEENITNFIFRSKVFKFPDYYTIILGIPLSAILPEPVKESKKNPIKCNVVVNNASYNPVIDAPRAELQNQSNWWEALPNPQSFLAPLQHRVYWTGEKIEDQNNCEKWADLSLT